jgi:mono/diheme cytochrome c family protein
MTGIGIFVCAGVALAQQPAPQGSVDAGRQVFVKIGCWTCHDTAGQGGSGTGPRIGPTALSFDAFLHELRSPVNQMVPVPASILSDADAADIYAYLQSQKKENYKQIPLLNQ